MKQELRLMPQNLYGLEVDYHPCGLAVYYQGKHVGLIKEHHSLRAEPCGYRQGVLFLTGGRYVPTLISHSEAAIAAQMAQYIAQHPGEVCSGTEFGAYLRRQEIP